MKREFKILTINATADMMLEAILGLTPLMSKRLAKLVNVESKNRTERNQLLWRIAKEETELFVESYQLVVAMREYRMEKTFFFFQLFLEWASKHRNIRDTKKVIATLSDALSPKTLKRR